MGEFRWVFAVALFALSGAAAARERADDVEIRYTEYGVAHIEADTYEAAGGGAMDGP